MAPCFLPLDDTSGGRLTPSRCFVSRPRAVHIKKEGHSRQFMNRLLIAGSFGHPRHSVLFNRHSHSQ